MKNAASAVRTARGKSALPFWKRDGFIGYLFILPSLIGFAAFVAYPLIMAIGYSFTEWDGLSPARFIGVENYTYMFTTDPSFPKAIKATFLYVLMTVPLTLVFGLMDVLNFGHGAFIAVGAYVATLVLVPMASYVQADSLMLNLAALAPAA